MKRTLVWLAALGTLALGAATAWAADPIAYITEIQKKGAGGVGVRAAGAADWKTPRPLLALRPGDQIRAQGDARVVVLFHAGGGTKTVTAANSPFTVAPLTGGSGGGQLRAVTASVSQFLLGRQETPQYRRLATRGLCAEPLIVSPRHSRLFAGELRFEWEGCDRYRYTVRLAGPQGVLWEQKDLPRQTLVYPATAPPLTPGVPYRWELEAPGHPIERARFEVLTDGEAQRIRGTLALLDHAPGYSPVTLVVMRTAVLFEEGLYNEARRQLQAALAARPNEPSLWMLEGYVYQRIGLASLAADAFERAK